MTATDFLEEDYESGILANERGTNAKRMIEEFNDNRQLRHSFAGIAIRRREISVSKLKFPPVLDP